MIGEPSAEQAELLSTVRRFAERVLTPELARAVDDEHSFPADLYQQMADLGWLGIPFPQEYGGAGSDLMTMFLVIEELCRTMLAAGNIYFRNVVNGGLNVLASGNERQKQLLLPPLVRGELKMCYAMTEPDAGSDVSNIRTRATDVGDHFEISGTKVFITGAAESDWIQLFARTGDGPRDITTFLVDSRSPGIGFTEIPKLGNNAMKTYEVVFDRVLVPADMVLGDVNRAWSHVRRSLDLERVAVSTECIGAARDCFDHALSYAQQRVQFGQAIIEFQGIQHKLAEMRMDLEASRLLTYRAAELVQNGADAGLHAAMAKYHTGITYFRCAIDGMAILGGYGYTKHFAMERHLRDSALYRIVPGPEVLKNTIAQKILREGATK